MFLLPALESHEIFSVSNATWCHCVWQAFLLWIQRQCICLDKTSRIRWMLTGCIDHGNVYIYCSVPQIRPPFCNLSLNTKHGGGLYAGCDNFSYDYALPSNKANSIVICRWGVEAKREASPNARRRDAPDASGRLTSFSVEGRESRALPRSSWHVHRWRGLSVFAVDTLTVDSQVAKIEIISIIRLRNKSSSGRAYARDKGTSAGLCAKNAGGGGMGEGGRICGTLRYCT